MNHYFVLLRFYSLSLAIAVVTSATTTKYTKKGFGEFFLLVKEQFRVSFFCGEIFHSFSLLKHKAVSSIRFNSFLSSSASSAPVCLVVFFSLGNYTTLCDDDDDGVVGREREKRKKDSTTARNLP